MNKHLIAILFLSLLYPQAGSFNIEKLNNSQLDILRNQLMQNEITQDSSDSEEINRLSIDKVNIEEKQTFIPQESVPSKEIEYYYGYEYLKRDIEFYDNLPTPGDFTIGPGDEIRLSIWGMSNLQKDFIVNKDGAIYYEKIGPILLQNLSINEAELLLLDKFSDIFSTLKENSNLKVELIKTRSVNVFFTGEVNTPGINIIHPFSDIFTALTQAGGVKITGSLRNVQLIRGGEIFREIDFYDFFNSGKNTDFANIRILDNDVIFVPPIKKRVKVDGEVNRAGFYELKNDETIDELITYASGITPTASSSVIVDRVLPFEKRSSNDYSKSSLSIDLINSSSNEKILFNGDVLEILKLDDVNSRATVYGRVKNPGSYPILNSSLKDILDLAGGFNDPVFRKTISDKEIIILRRDERKLYSNEIKINYENADDVQLEVDDKIFVYENINYRNSYIYTIIGEVNSPGSYPHIDGITLNEAISRAGGLTGLSNKYSYEIYQNFNEESSALKVSNVTLNSVVIPNSLIEINPISNLIKVEGNTFSPGIILIEESVTVRKAINLAGGLKPFSDKNKIYLERANGAKKRVRNINSSFIRLYPGDSIFIPKKENYEPFDITNFLSTITSTLANVVAIIAIIENQSSD